MRAGDRRRLPRREVELSVLGLGCAQWGGMFTDMPFEACAGLVDVAREVGVTFIDTAPYYGYTRAERRLGALLDGNTRDRFTISTKAGRLMVPDPTVPDVVGEWARPLPFRPQPDYSYDAILRSFHDSRQRLGVLRIDILLAHDIGRLTHGERHAEHWAALTAGGGFRAMGELRDAGLVGAIGLGVNEWEVAAEALDAFDIDCTLLAGRYTLLEQTSLPFLDRCAREGVAIIAGGVFNSGVLAGSGKHNYVDASPDILGRVEQLRRFCAHFGVPLEAAALQFPLHHPAVVCCLAGAQAPEHLRRNAALLAHPIPDPFWRELASSGLIDAASPVTGGL